MSDKKNISATIDQDVASFVQRDDVNTSGLINKLLKQHMSGGTGEEQMLQFRMQQVQSEIESLEDRLENKRSEYAELEDRWDALQEETTEVLENAAENLSLNDLRQQNRKVQYWADEAGMDIDEFVDELEDRVQ